jgi:hypothetical protein
VLAYRQVIELDARNGAGGESDWTMRIYVEGKSQMIDRQYDKTDVILIAILSVYCIAFFLASLGYLSLEYKNLQDNGNTNDPVLLQLCVVIGILGAITRGASRLFDDVGSGAFDPKRSLSIIMRPIEGGGMAIVAFFFFRSLLLVLEQGDAPINPWGFLSISVMAGMFSHRAADGMRERFGRLITSPPPGDGSSGS